MQGVIKGWVCEGGTEGRLRSRCKVNKLINNKCKSHTNIFVSSLSLMSSKTLVHDVFRKFRIHFSFLRTGQTVCPYTSTVIRI